MSSNMPSASTKPTKGEDKEEILDSIDHSSEDIFGEKLKQAMAAGDLRRKEQTTSQLKGKTMINVSSVFSRPPAQERKTDACGEPEPLYAEYTRTPSFPPDPFVKRLTEILDSMVEPSSHPLNVAKALRPIASFLLSSAHIPLPRRRLIAYAVVKFFDSQEARAQERDPKHNSLSDLLICTPSMPFTVRVESVLHILSALFVLAGPLLFTRKATLALLVQAFEATSSFSTHQSIDILRESTWNCLIWGFSQMTVWRMLRAKRIVVLTDAFNAIKEHLLIDVAINLVANILGPRGERRTNASAAEHAAIVVVWLAEYCETPCIGFEVLNYMLGRADTDYSENDASLIPAWLMNESPPQVESDVVHVFGEPRQLCLNGLSAIRPLDDVELPAMSRYWPKLLRVCKLATMDRIKTASQSMKHTHQMRLEDSFVFMWRVLLRFRARLCGPAYLLVDGAAGNITAALEYLLDIDRIWKRCEISLDKGEEISIHAIDSVLQLWAVAREELDEIWMRALSKSIFRTFVELRSKIELNALTTVNLWYDLMFEIVRISPPQALNVLKQVGTPEHAKRREDTRAYVQLVTWDDLVVFVLLPELEARGENSEFSVKDLVAFLFFPEDLHLLDGQVSTFSYQLWIQLHHKTVVLAQARGEEEVVYPASEMFEPILEDYLSATFDESELTLALACRDEEMKKFANL